MKSGVSDVGSHVIIYTNHVHEGRKRITPVTTADHCADEAPWTRAIGSLSRSSSGLGLSSLLFSKIQTGFARRPSILQSVLLNQGCLENLI